ncbi:MAG: DUF2946 family protein [Paracoccaceae bacterium]
MSNALHMVAVILLALALALAGGSRAMLLAHGNSVESVEICADAGIEVVFLDADGNRTKSPMDCSHCPDCLDNSAPVLLTLMAAKPFRAARRAQRQTRARNAAHPTRKLRPEARGPPPTTPEMHETAPAVALPYAALRSSSGQCHRDGQPKSEARI